MRAKLSFLNTLPFTAVPAAQGLSLWSSSLCSSLGNWLRAGHCSCSHLRRVSKRSWSTALPSRPVFKRLHTLPQPTPKTHSGKRRGRTDAVDSPTAGTLATPSFPATQILDETAQSQVLDKILCGFAGESLQGLSLLRPLNTRGFNSFRSRNWEPGLRDQTLLSLSPDSRTCRLCD